MTTNKSKSVPDIQTVLLNSCSVMLKDNKLYNVNDSLKKISFLLYLLLRTKRDLEKKQEKLKKEKKISISDCKTLNRKCPNNDQEWRDAVKGLEEKLSSYKKDKSSENNSDRNYQISETRKLLRLLKRVGLSTFTKWKKAYIMWHQNIPYAVVQDQKQTHLVQVTRLAKLRPSSYYCKCGSKTGYFNKFCPATKKWVVTDKTHCGKGSCTALKDMVLKAMESGKL